MRRTFSEKEGANGNKAKNMQCVKDVERNVCGLLERTLWKTIEWMWKWSVSLRNVCDVVFAWLY